MFSREQIIADQKFKAYSHFNERLNQRYGINVTEEEYDELCRENIDIIERKSRNRALAWLMVKGYKVLVVKDVKRNRFLATALPPEILDPPKPKFQPVVPKEPWTSEKTLDRIVVVSEEVKQIDREITKIERKIHGLRKEKVRMQERSSNKSKYINQLKNQLLDKWSHPPFNINQSGEAGNQQTQLSNHSRENEASI